MEKKHMIIMVMKYLTKIMKIIKNMDYVIMILKNIYQEQKRVLVEELD